MVEPSNAPARCFALGVFIVVFIAPSARAHAPPQATGLFSASQPGEAKREWVRTNRGVIFRRAASNDSPRLLCNDAYGASLSEVSPMSPAADGLLVSSYGAGLIKIAPDGCSVEKVPAPLADRRVIDLWRGPDEGRLFALLAPSDTRPGGVLASTDAARTWVALGDFAAFGSAVLAAPSDSSRVYVSAQLETANGEPSHTLLVSNDGAASFNQHPVSLFASEVRAFVVGVDPLDRDRVFLRTLAGNPDEPERVLLSEDGGASFQEVCSAVGPLVLALFEQTAWLGGRDGLLRSDDRGKTFHSVEGAPTFVGCVTSSGAVLSVCGYREGAFGVFRSVAGAAFESELSFSQVREQVACAVGNELVSLCRQSFLDWTAEQISPGTAGVLDAGMGASSDGSARESARTPPAGCSMLAPSSNARMAPPFSVACACLIGWSSRRQRKAQRV